MYRNPNILEKHTASIFRAEVMLGSGWEKDQARGTTNQSQCMKRGYGNSSGQQESTPYRERGRKVRSKRERGKFGHLRGQKGG
jgi:hypothetical protein